MTAHICIGGLMDGKLLDRPDNVGIAQVIPELDSPLCISPGDDGSAMSASSEVQTYVLDCIKSQWPIWFWRLASISSADAIQKVFTSFGAGDRSVELQDEDGIDAFTIQQLRTSRGDISPYIDSVVKRLKSRLASSIMNNTDLTQVDIKRYPDTSVLVRVTINVVPLIGG
jgi:hypothetical protein